MIRIILLFALSTAVNASISDIVSDKAQQYGVDEKLVHAVIRQESSYNPRALSHAGAGGIMQLMPGTARRFGVSDRFNPEQNIDGGVHYLRVLLDMFSGNVKLAVAAYNAGEGAVIKYNYSIPPYAETQDYVRKVLGFYGKDTPIVESHVSIAKPLAVTSKKSMQEEFFTNEREEAKQALAEFYDDKNWE